MIKKVLAAVSVVSLAISLLPVFSGISKAASISDANTTMFGPNVYVFDPTMPAADIESLAGTIFTTQEKNQFGSQRYALLFKPGTYNVNIREGFYTHIAGLGQNPGDMSITGGLNVDAKWANGNATQNFWRSIENLTIAPSSGKMRWAVSQAAPMRRVHVKGNLELFDFDANFNAGWASGGYLADSIVDNKVTPASQQQWFNRNNQYASWGGSVWNTVMVGDALPPAATFPDPPYTIVANTPVVREKPYLYVNSNGQYNVFVPALQTNTKGVSWANGSTPGSSLSIDQFYIARPETATAASINAALNQGKHLLFTPGIFHLNDTIRINNANTVILGIGLPTLISDNGKIAMSVADVDGVKISGLLFDAGPSMSPSLLEVGPTGSSLSHSSNPTILQDLYFRVGGAGPGLADIDLKINSSNVIGDHFWIWRADHGTGSGWGVNDSNYGLVVNGNDVTIYGLFNEHHNKYQTLWKGNGGRTYFYQSEIPYDVPNQSSWMSKNGMENGYPSYKVADGVTTHEAWGLGVYSFFRDAAVKLDSAIEVPDVTGVKVHHMTTIWLSGTAGSEITHVINGNGGRVYANSPSAAMRQTVAEFQGVGTGVPTALDRTGWTATTSPVNSTPSNMLDGNMSTRWTTGTDMVPGQYFIVDMKAAKTFNQLTIDCTGNSKDYARGYQVFVSNDGTNWGNEIASGTGTAPLITINFAPKTARYIKVVQTATATNWWSVREFNVYN
ncbi:discoidin domain-containing protein [Paenibacillus ferrarius]|uniref:discoidin domain-containing protein n=1 Tax=Paenibacillus ferrarius TaxID=1469647 RepID=UPI003D29B4F0